MSVVDHNAIELPRISEAEVGDYLALLKPRVMSLVIFTALVGLVIAPGHIHPIVAFTSILCIAVGAGASGALNMAYEGDIDALMSRTANRPIPRGRITREEATAFGLVLSFFSVMTLGILVNWLAGGLLAFTIFFYVVVYTMLLKRWTAQNIVIGGAAGALPPVVAWAAATGSPIDIVGFALWPSATGAKTLDAARGAADRWMRESRSTKDHWVFASGGFPQAHGEMSQENAVWSALAWATSRPGIKGFIVAEAGDYGTIRGIRAADGHLRRVAPAIKRALRGLQETALPDSTPVLKKGQQRVGG